MDDYMTTKQAAEELGCVPAHIRRLCEQGILAAIKPGHDWLVKRQAVLDFKANPPKRGRPPKAKEEGSENG